jgi:uncharacterized protein (DUF433 family)
MWSDEEMKALDRITFDPYVMGGKACVRGMGVTAGTIVGLMAAGHDKAQIIEMYPYLEPEDIDQALLYATWRAEEIDVPISSP